MDGIARGSSTSTTGEQADYVESFRFDGTFDVMKRDAPNLVCMLERHLNHKHHCQLGMELQLLRPFALRHHPKFKSMLSPDAMHISPSR